MPDHLNQFLLTGKTLIVIAFPFQNAPESLHGAVVNAVSHAGHTLLHSGLYELVVECSAGILETSVAMEQRMGIRISFHCLIKCLVDEGIVITLTQRIGHDTPVTEIQNGTQIELMYLKALIPFELRYIGQPFLIRLCGVKLAIQKVFSNILRVLSLPGAAMAIIFHSRSYVPGTADAQYPLVIYMDTMVMTQIIIESSVTFIWAFLVDLFDLVRKAFILRRSPAQFSGCPFVVGRTGYMEQFAGRFNGKSLYLMALFNGYVNMALSYF